SPSSGRREVVRAPHASVWSCRRGGWTTRTAGAYTCKKMPTKPPAADRRLGRHQYWGDEWHVRDTHRRCSALRSSVLDSLITCSGSICEEHPCQQLQRINAVAKHRHKRETNARVLPRAALVSAPIAVLATVSAVTLGMMSSEP